MNKIKVRVEFRDGRVKEFYAQESFQPAGEGRLVYWNDDDRKQTISYPTDTIFEIIEIDI